MYVAALLLGINEGSSQTASLSCTPTMKILTRNSQNEYAKAFPWLTVVICNWRVSESLLRKTPNKVRFAIEYETQKRTKPKWSLLYVHVAFP